MSLLAAHISLIVCHAGPAEQFASFQEVLSSRGHTIEVFATGPALAKLTSAIPFEIENETPEKLVSLCQKADIVITDAGHPFDIPLQNAFKEKAPQIKRVTYYDNLEPFVPGGYSQTASKVMQLAEKVLFANTHLEQAALLEKKSAPIDLSPEKKIGIGFYPLEKALELKERRKQEQAALRAQFFQEQGLDDIGQPLLLYIGGNNQTYFEEAFPAFVSIIQEIPAPLFILQQHPGAKQENRDALYAKQAGVPLILSEKTTPDMLTLCDGVLYFQTSMAPQFVLAGIPTLQIGKEPYQDLLVRQDLIPVVTSSKELLKELSSLEPPSEAGLLDSLGIAPDWPDRLEQALLSKP